MCACCRFDVDDLFSEMIPFFAAPQTGTGVTRAPRQALMRPIHTDFIESEKGYEIRADMPGIAKEDIKVRTWVAWRSGLCVSCACLVTCFLANWGSGIVNFIFFLAANVRKAVRVYPLHCNENSARCECRATILLRMQALCAHRGLFLSGVRCCAAGCGG